MWRQTRTESIRQADMGQEGKACLAIPYHAMQTHNNCQLLALSIQALKGTTNGTQVPCRSPRLGVEKLLSGPVTFNLDAWCNGCWKGRNEETSPLPKATPFLMPAVFATGVMPSMGETAVPFVVTRWRGKLP